MKRIFLVTGLALGLMACNDQTTAPGSNNTADSANHGAHQHTSGATTTADTSGMAGKNMMTMMNGMMVQMKNMRSTGNPDNDFAALMKAHHLGAIEMAQLELAKGTDARIRQMAQEMIDDQQLSYTEYARHINHSSKWYRKQLQADPLSLWLYESYTIAQKLHDEIEFENPRLSYRYMYDHIHTVETQLLKGGIRLAGLLNEIFG